MNDPTTIVRFKTYIYKGIEIPCEIYELMPIRNINGSRKGKYDWFLSTTTSHANRLLCPVKDCNQHIYYNRSFVACTRACASHDGLIPDWNTKKHTFFATGEDERPMLIRRLSPYNILGDYISDDEFSLHLGTFELPF